MFIFVQIIDSNCNISMSGVYSYPITHSKRAFDVLPIVFQCNIATWFGGGLFSLRVSAHGRKVEVFGVGFY